MYVRWVTLDLRAHSERRNKVNLDVIKAKAVAKSARAALLVKKNSPELLLGGGIVLGVGATAYAIYATWKAKDVVEEAKMIIGALEVAGESALPADLVNGDHDVEEIQKMVAIDAGMKLAKLYFPVVAMSVVSIGMVVKGHNILSRRNAGLVAAYKTLDEAYKKYRKRVQEEFGDDVDNYIRRKQRLDKELMVVDEKGKEVDFSEALDLTPEEQNMVDFGASQYAKFFDASSPQWRHDNDSNIYFLRSQQTNANVLLTVNGHLFLNEVYKMLGLPETKAGCVVGWVKGNGDDIIDFGIFNAQNDYNADFINGYQREHILLDFNVDGWIWDLI